MNKFSLFRNIFSLKKSNQLLNFLILLDCLFIFAHILIVCLVFFGFQISWAVFSSIRVDFDNGYPEMFQYFKYFIIIIIIISLIYKKKKYHYFSWLFVFVFLLLDDSMQLHENCGGWIAQKFNYSPAFGLRAQDLGELTFVSVVGIGLMLFLILGFYFGDKKIRKINIDIGLIFSVFLFFGVVVDILHQLLSENETLSFIMVLLEDGGEMIVLSVMTWYFLFITLEQDKQSNFLHEYIFVKKRG
ncbi:MAG: hypothetical protein ABJL44_19545 [Algibacter sp.]